MKTYLKPGLWTRTYEYYGRQLTETRKVHRVAVIRGVRFVEWSTLDRDHRYTTKVNDWIEWAMHAQFAG